MIGWLQINVSVSKICTWSFHPLGWLEFYRKWIRIWVILQMFIKLYSFVWFMNKAKWVRLADINYFNIPRRPYPKTKLHLPKKMFHQIQKFPKLYLQVNIHNLQKILTCLIESQDTKNSNIHRLGRFKKFFFCHATEEAHLHI